MQDLFAIATDQPFRFPATFTFVIRAFSTLEGTVVSLSVYALFKGDPIIFLVPWEYVSN